MARLPLAPLLPGALVALTACPGSHPPPPPCSDPLFGRPVAATGLDSSACHPSCSCATAFTARDWTQPQVDGLKAWSIDAPFAEVTSDPYAIDGGVDAGPPGQACAVVVTDALAHHYRVQTFDSPGTAADAGALLTHHDACGVCSTLADLAVYAANPDLGAPVKQCGLQTFNQPFEADVQCLQALGFTRPCAQIWAYNTANTRNHCLAPCLGLPADAGYNLPDGGLNACLLCDEQQSGPVFKAVAGRTRRNSGVPNAICRPCSEVRPLRHAY